MGSQQGQQEHRCHGLPLGCRHACQGMSPLWQNCMHGQDSSNLLSHDESEHAARLASYIKIWTATIHDTLSGLYEKQSECSRGGRAWRPSQMAVPLPPRAASTSNNYSKCKSDAHTWQAPRILAAWSCLRAESMKISKKGPVWRGGSIIPRR